MSPCRPLQVVCAAPDRESLSALKRAAVGAEWELSQGATSAPDALDQLEDHHAKVLVVREPVPGLVAEARRRFASIRVVCVGRPQEGEADVVVDSLAEVRAVVWSRPASEPSALPELDGSDRDDPGRARSEDPDRHR